MPLGMKVTTGDFLPIVKFDARAGRLSRVDKRVDGGSDVVEVPQGTTFAFDMGTLEAGYICFTQQGPVRMMVPYYEGVALPAQPADKDAEGKNLYRPGFYVKIAGKALGGAREWAGNAAVLLNAVDDLYQSYRVAPEAAAGMIPIVCIAGTVAVKSGSGARSSTNYGPVFRIESWIPRHEILGPRTTPLPVAVAAPVVVAAATAPVVAPVTTAPNGATAAPPDGMPF